jgi:hypothetical protein
MFEFVKFIGAMPYGLYYKTITIVIMTIVSDATIWSITLTIVIMARLAKARIVNYDRL